MKTNFKDLNTGDFFIFELNGGINYYQKIYPADDYNCIHLNSGNLCKIYEENTNLEKVNVTINHE